MDFPTAWTIARATPVADHNPCCSYAQTDGGLLCDCRVLTEHPAYLADYGPAGADMHLRPAKNPQRGERADERNHQTPGDDTAGGKPATTPLPAPGTHDPSAGSGTCTCGHLLVLHVPRVGRCTGSGCDCRTPEAPRG